MVIDRFQRMVVGVLSAIFALTSVAAAQQSGSLSGFIYDADFDAPLANATVSIAELDERTKTTDQGRYAFGELPEGRYTLVVVKEGYGREVIADVVIARGRVTERDVRLAGDFYVMDEFLVQDIAIGGDTEVGLLELRAVSPQLMDSIGADFLSLAGASDAAQGLRLVSGATTTSGSFAAVRGLPPRYVNTQLNGFFLPSADPDTRSVQLDLFPAEVIESIQVSKTFTPDQQGAASGGAVNIVTKSIPEENFIKFSSKVEFNTQRPDNGEFLVDGRGPVNFFGIDGSRELPDMGFAAPISFTQFGNAGATFGEPPLQYDMGVTGGLQHTFEEGVRIGGLVSAFWDQGMGHSEDRINEDRIVSTQGANEQFGLVPDVTGNDFEGFLQDPEDGGESVLSSMFRETQSEHEVTWGALGSVGVESENHSFNFTYMHTRTTTATATIAEDTIAKELKFSGFDQNDRNSPGAVNSPDGATNSFGQTFSAGNFTGFTPYRRLETQEYLERSVESFQFNGEHVVPILGEGFGWEGVLEFSSPKIDWNVARSISKREEPGTRFLDSIALPAGTLDEVNGAAPDGQVQLEVDFPNQAQLGAYNILFQDIVEASTQTRFNGELPFENWTGEKGYVKIGVFDDDTRRDYVKETFAGLSDATGGVRFFEPFSGVRFSEAVSNPDQFPVGKLGFDVFAGVPGRSLVTGDDPGNLVEAVFDFTYVGKQRIDAWYWMLDFPITPYFKLTGGLRFEDTALKTSVQPETPATVVFLDTKESLARGFNPGGVETGLLGVGVLDADIEREDVLPSLSFSFLPFEAVTLRGAYSQTIARPTFRELTPVSQVLFGGQTPFVGNPFLKVSEVENYDLRLDIRPYPDALVSLSYFQKDVKDHIQVTSQAPGTDSFVVPVNFPQAEIEGLEVEVRQNLGRLDRRLAGLTVGANATFLSTEVKLRDFEADQLARTGFPISTVPMTDAPELLYNLFMTFNSEDTGTQLSAFFTYRGDTLVIPPGVKQDFGLAPGSSAPAQFFEPAVYEKGFGTLNVTLSQKLGKYFTLKFSAKNLTNPARETVYRSEFVGDDVVRTRSKAGIDLSLSLSAKFEF